MTCNFEVDYTEFLNPSYAKIQKQDVFKQGY